MDGTINRRRFIQSTLAAAASSAFRFPDIHGRRPTSVPKKVLVLGGTCFLGPAVVEAAVVAGHSVTLFNRGITNPDLFPRLEKLRGLRSPTPSQENWAALGSQSWDAVIDVWPSDPVLADSAARRLRDRAAHYLYVSSIAAYEARGFATAGLTEDAALAPWDSTATLYKRGKAESERRLHALVGDRLTVVRPGPIKGARDDTPDLLAWLRRAREGAQHIGPGSGDDHVQIVDVEDVARFLVLAIDRALYGTFNLTGAPMTFREFVDRCRVATRSSAAFLWIPGDFLHEEGLDPDPGSLGAFPFWHPEPVRRGFFQISSRRAFDAGWTQRPFTETALDSLWWFDSLDPASFRWTDELTRDVEERVIRRWLSRR